MLNRFTWALWLGATLSFGCFAKTETDPGCALSGKTALSSPALAGSAQRRFLFFRIYSVELWLPSAVREHLPEEESARARQLLSANTVKELRLHYARDLDIAKVREVLHEGFKANASAEEWAKEKNTLNTLLALMTRDVVEDDRLKLLWQPQCGLRVFYNDAPIFESNSTDFAKPLLSIWLGENSVVDRSRLLGLQ